VCFPGIVANDQTSTRPQHGQLIKIKLADQDAVLAKVGAPSNATQRFRSLRTGDHNGLAGDNQRSRVSRGRLRPFTRLYRGLRRRDADREHPQTGPFMRADRSRTHRFLPRRPYETDEHRFGAWCWPRGRAGFHSTDAKCRPSSRA
jgi:hypothetical protein